jgi:osmotically-inducible protein OsmY
VGRRYQKEGGGQAVRYLSGVRGGANKFETEPIASAANMRTKIEEALRRIAEVDAHRIKADTRGGTVALSGNVRSWAEMEEAERAAWGAPGMKEILNLIEIVS